MPVTQLYVSVDAPNPAQLEAVDRPLFKDAWDRLRRSLSLLRDRGQRTVARLTIVKGWNSDDIGGYADLIALGRVSFVELKGVTYCGTSDASNLNMSNSPWHHEVVEFAEKLMSRLNTLRGRGGDAPEYGLACEHRHSCSVLLARVDQFRSMDADGNHAWSTWVDYPVYNSLALGHHDEGNEFSVLDYRALTPGWAISGAEEEGFDPTDRRHRRKGKTPKYAKFDKDGVPTHDHREEQLDASVRKGLEREMEEAIKAWKEAGEEVVKVEKGGRKIEDPKLMFRGLTMGV